MFGTRVRASVFGVLGLCTKRRYNDIYQLVLRLLVSARLHEIHGMFVVCATNVCVCVRKVYDEDDDDTRRALSKALLVKKIVTRCVPHGRTLCTEWVDRETQTDLLTTTTDCCRCCCCCSCRCWCYYTLVRACARAPHQRSIFAHARACATQPSSFMMCAASVQVYCSGLLRVCL